MTTLQFLGTGNAFSDFRQNYFNNALVVGPEGHHLLIDCGGTAPQSLKELGISLHTVGIVFVTHMHDDHITGIGQLALERYYTPRPGEKWPAKQKTTIIAPALVMEDLKVYLSKTLNLFTPVPNSPEETVYSEMTQCGMDQLFDFWTATEVGITPNFKARFFPVHHARVPAYGMTFAEGGTVKFVYTSPFMGTFSR